MMDLVLIGAHPQSAAEKQMFGGHKLFCNLIDSCAFFSQLVQDPDLWNSSTQLESH
jgi:hypothetical protein